MGTCKGLAHCVGPDLMDVAVAEQKISVLLVDGHLVVRNGLRLKLHASRDIEVTGEARNAAQALAMVLTQAFDVVLMDIGLPDQSGLELLKRIRVVRPELAVLMFSMYAEEIYAVHALKLGAAGYFTKSSSVETVVDAIRRAVHGDFDKS
jgi:DNA-binding NarL/FixJ family response regulator